MQKRSINAILYICFVGVIAVFIGQVYSEEDPHPSVKIPIIPGSYNITRIFNNPPKTKSLNYFMQARYPADEVLAFYNLKFKEIGYVPSLNKFKRKWERFIDSAIEGNPKVRQLLALWINPDLKLEAFLALRYIENGESWSNELHVICQIQPLIDTGRLEKFFRRLSESGKQAEFMKLLDSYRMSDGEVDIGKAVNENPDNYYLKEYKSIIDEMNLQKGD